MQCPELISDIVKENNLGVEEITEICTSLQTNKAEELNAVLKNMRWKNWFKKRRFIKEAEKVAFEKMYIFERGEPKARLKAAIRVPQKVIKEDLHRRLKWISDPVDFLKSVKNPDVFFIKAFLNWNAEYGNIKRTCTEVQTFLNGRIRPLSEMAMDEIIEFMEERKRKEQEKEKKFFLEKKFPNEKSLTEIDETSKPPSELMQILPSILQHTH
ncbi:MAG: hypothetical protein JXQ74_01875 [Alphaproteobacteria bacterium]|nr:hypothetical protein [Alphaproteobacteria bacterium]